MTATETIRFTGKERDAETGLDYFGARYFSAAQGRFTSADPIHFLPQRLLDPQQWNMYAYARNNPLRFIDPTGMYVDDCAQGDKDCVKRIDNFEKARQKDLKSKNEAVRDAAAQYGNRGDDNGVTVRVVNAQQMQQAVGGNANGAVVPVPGQDEDRLNVYINSSLGGKDLQRTIAHEGTHLGMMLDFVNGYDAATGKYDANLNFTSGQTEFIAFMTGAAVKKYDYPGIPCGGAGGCQFGPKDANKINQFLHNHPVYGRQYYLPVFDPRTWPQ
jgi:RHS repeat-associated protein